MLSLDNDHAWLEAVPEHLWEKDDQALGTHIAALCSAALKQQVPCDFIQRYFARLGRVALASEQLREFAVMSRQAYARWRDESASVAEWMRMLGRDGKPTMADFKEYELYYDR